MKLAVEIIDAHDLMPKDNHGSANPYVEVDFAGHLRRTSPKPNDLNPSWNQTLLFPVSNPSLLPRHTITLSLYIDATAGGRRKFLGRVRIPGIWVSPSLKEAPIHRLPLDKRGLFSYIRGDIAVRLYTVPDSAADEHAAGCEGDDSIAPKKFKQRPAASKIFYSLGAGPVGIDKRRPTPGTELPAAPPRQPPAEPRQLPEYGLVETRPPLAARLPCRAGVDKLSTTYDLVEPMYYLYANVVKARGLPAVDVTGGIDAYAEVRLGNYRGITKVAIRNQHPVWNQVFAFSNIQASLLEVAVKDKNAVLKDEVVGKVDFDVSDVPARRTPDSPLAPQWYRFVGAPNGAYVGEIMLAVWVGTQADEAFPDAWLSDAHSLGHDALPMTHSKVYFAPKLCYLRVHVIEAQDLLGGTAAVRVQLGHQHRRTRASPAAVWNEELMFVAADPFDEELSVIVVDEKGEPIGSVLIPLSAAQQRAELDKPIHIPSRWFSLSRPIMTITGEVVPAEEKRKEPKFASRIHLRLCLEAAYHVLDEMTHYSSDLRPASKHLHKPSVGILELGILSARNLLPSNPPDSYCVAKYGPKWCRTRTVISSPSPQWNEQYTWEVFDPCTVLTVAVFSAAAAAAASGGGGDQRIGKIRIRVSTLEASRVYTHYHPLLSLNASGLKKSGELHLAVRFTCSSWANLLTIYGTPLLPRMHYLQPIPILQLDYLRHQAATVVAARLGRAEPPLRREVVESMLDVETHIWSMRKSKANFHRLISLFSCFAAVARWFDDVRNWRSPSTTVLVHVLVLILLFYPELILPTVFLYLFVIGMWNYRYRVREPAHLDVLMSGAAVAEADEMDEEMDTFPTGKSPKVVRRRYDRLRSVAGRVQTVAGDLATQGERAAALLRWRDPRATGIFAAFALVAAVVMYVTPVREVGVVVVVYVLRHPRFRSRTPSVGFSFYRRLPSKADMLL